MIVNNYDGIIEFFPGMLENGFDTLNGIFTAVIINQNDSDFFQFENIGNPGSSIPELKRN